MRAHEVVDDRTRTAPAERTRDVGLAATRDRLTMRVVRSRLGREEERRAHLRGDGARREDRVHRVGVGDPARRDEREVDRLAQRRDEIEHRQVGAVCIRPRAAVAAGLCALRHERVGSRVARGPSLVRRRHRHPYLGARRVQGLDRRRRRASERRRHHVYVLVDQELDLVREGVVVESRRAELDAVRARAPARTPPALRRQRAGLDHEDVDAERAVRQRARPAHLVAQLLRCEVAAARGSPRPPAFDTAAASSGVEGPPAMGACTIGTRSSIIP